MNLKRLVSLGLLVLSLNDATAYADTTTPPTVGDNTLRPFICKVGDGQLTALMQPISPTETYSQNLRFKGLDIATYQNEDNRSYNVQIKQAGKLILATDVVMYVDTSMRLSTSSGMIQVQCLVQAR